ncbi:MAG: hypothetical protein ACREFM_18390 [Hypericibacter sp.]
MTDAALAGAPESAGVEEAQRLYRRLRRCSLACILSFLLAVPVSAVIAALAARTGDMQAASMIPFAVGLVYLVLFIVTLSTARYFGEAIGLRGYRWSVRWTMISCVIPLLSFVRPWLGFGETYRSLINAAKTRRLDASWNHGFSILTLLVAIFTVLDFVLSRSEGNNIRALPPTELWLTVAASLLSLILPIVFLGRVRRAAKRLLALYLERLAGPVAPAAAP